MINNGLSPTGTDGSSALESYFSKVRSKQYQISEIIFDTGKIDFIKSTDPREDLTSGGGPAALDRIQIKDKNENIIKQFKFNYEYKQGTIDGNELQSLIQLDPTATKRLFLSSIQELDSLNNSNPPHIFVYNDEQIPNRHSNSQDAWGYYNGMPNGEFLTFFEYGANTNNRTVDLDKSKAGILEKIIYPTGGSTDFIYEHNKVIPSIAYSQVVTALTNPLINRSEWLSHIEYTTPHYNHTTNTYEKQFEIKSVYPGGGGGITAIVDFQNPNDACDRDDPNQTACNFSIQLWKENAFIAQLYFGDNLIYALPGLYTLKVIPYKHPVHNPILNMNQTFDVLLTWKEQEIDESTLLHAAGKRIKRIEHKDSNDDVLSFKEYEYNDPDSGGTSGHLFGLPNYMSIHSTSGINGVQILAPTGASVGTPVSSMQGNSVGYEYVTEYYGDKNNNLGKIEYSYTVTQDVGNYFQYPYNLPTDNSWIRGKNISAKYFSSDENNEFTLEKEVINTYMYGGVRHSNLYSNPQVYMQPNSYLREVALNIFQESEYLEDRNKFNQPLMVCHYITGGADNEFGINYKTYHLNGGTQDLMKTTSKEYFDDGSIHETITENFFDYNNHYQLKSTETTNSKGEVLKNLNYYPTDINSLIGLDSEASIAALDLEARNRFEVLQTDLLKDNVLQSRIRNNYNLWGIHQKRNAVKNIQTAKGVHSTLEDRIIYHKYDDKGNPLEVSKKDGSRIYYVWGYDKKYPIAKIEGYTCQIVNDPIKGDKEVCFTTVQWAAISATQNASLNENNADTEANLRVKLQELRDSFASSNAQVTSFTYDPLIGVTSITDPRGTIIYYHYDSFNRLQFVKDKDGNVLSENEYNYKN